MIFGNILDKVQNSSVLSSFRDETYDSSEDDPAPTLTPRMRVYLGPRKTASSTTVSIQASNSALERSLVR